MKFAITSPGHEFETKCNRIIEKNQYALDAEHLLTVEQVGAFISMYMYTL